MVIVGQEEAGWGIVGALCSPHSVHVRGQPGSTIDQMIRSHRYFH